MKSILSTLFTGIEFENPFLLSSAPPTESESNILRAFDAGWGGVVVKTIGLHPVVNVFGARTKFFRTTPDDNYVSMKKRSGSALHGSWNWELISDKPLDWWVPRIRRMKEAFPTRVVIASIMAGSGSDKELRNWQQLAQGCQDAGADGLECNFSCPHMDRKDMGSNMARMCQAFPDRAFSGIGGVSDFAQALSYFLLGCGTVQVCTAAMLDSAVGPSVIKRLNSGLDAFLEKHADKGWTTVEDFRG